MQFKNLNFEDHPIIPDAIQATAVCNNGKRISVAEMISRGMNKDVIEEEIKKCVVLCRRHHAEVEMKGRKDEI